MVVTPAEAKELTKAEEEAVRTIEDKIDGSLMQCSRYINLNNFPNEKIRKRIISMYQAVGWNVEYITGQRVGNYLRFMEARV